MRKRSARTLTYRLSGGHLEFLLVHPGRPGWMKKDLGAWTIPKGEYAAGEKPLAAYAPGEAYAYVRHTSSLRPWPLSPEGSGPPQKSGRR
jgi:hypothetical protein